MPPLLKDRRFLLISAVAIILVGALLLTRWQGGKLVSQKLPPPPAPKKTVIALPKSSTPSSAIKVNKISCPAIATFCLKGQDIAKGETYMGFGSKIATNSAILATFDGEITTISLTLPPQFQNEKIETIYLDNKQLGLRAIYQFKGQSSSLQKVKKGQKIAAVGEPISYYDNVSLVFALVKGDFISGEKVKLTVQDFE